MDVTHQDIQPAIFDLYSVYSVCGNIPNGVISFLNTGIVAPIKYLPTTNTGKMQIFKLTNILELTFITVICLSNDEIVN